MDPATIGLVATLVTEGFELGVSQFNKSLDRLDKEVKGFAESMNGAFKQSSADLEIFGVTFKRIGDIINSIVIADTFRGIQREIGNLVQEVTSAVSVFQQLEIRFQTLAARDYMAEFGGNVQDALDASAGSAENMLQWVRQISVTTPFTMESLANTLAMAKSYNFTTSEAKDLALSIGDFTAGMGLSNTVMERIIYNMGQMMAAGKPTGRELRDLSNSFVPVIEIAKRMGEATGESTETMLENFSQGKVAAKDFIAEFQKLVAEQFEGSMARMSNTFEGVTNNIKDFIQAVLGFEVLGPIANKLATDLQKTLSSFLTKDTYDTAGTAGEALAFAYEKLSEVISGSLVPSFSSLTSVLGIVSPTLTDIVEGVLTVAANLFNFTDAVASMATDAGSALESIFEVFNTTFTQLTENMFVWGQNVIRQFALGIVEGIVFVIQAITSVANVITRMLEAHSPPLILPELEQWGASAMLSYMEGWSQVDFSAFEAIGGLLEKAIMSWGSKVKKTDLAERVIGSSVSLSKAVEEFRRFGTVSEDVLNGIAKSAGFATEEFNKFIRLSLEFQGLQDIANSVKEALDFEGVGNASIFGTMISSFSELRDLADQFGSNLSDIVRSYSVDAQRLIDINKQIEASQIQINEVTAQYDARLEALNEELRLLIQRQEDTTRIYDIDKALTSKILTARERERLELEKKRILLERQIKTTEKEKASTLTGLKATLDSYEKEKAAIKDRVDFEKEQLKSISQAQLDTAKSQLEAVRSFIEAQIKLNELYARTIEVEVKVKGSGAGGGIDLGLDDPKGLGDRIKELSLPKIQMAFDEMWKAIKAKVDEQWKAFGAIFDPIKQPFDDLVASIEKLATNPKLQGALNDFKDGIEAAFIPLSIWWNTEGKDLAESIGEIFGTIIGNIVADNPATGESLLDVVAKGVDAIAQSLADNGPELIKFFEKFAEFLNDSAFPAIQEILTDIMTNVIPGLIDFLVDSGPTILDILGFIVDNYKPIIAVLVAFKAMSILGPFFVLLAPALVSIAATLGIIVGPAGLFAASLGETLKNAKSLIDLSGKAEKTEPHVGPNLTPQMLSGSGLDPVERIIGVDMSDTGIGKAVEFMKNIVLEAGNTLDMLGQIIQVKTSEWWATFTDWAGKTFGPEGTIQTSLSDFSESISLFFTDIGSKAELWINSVFGPEGTIPAGFATFKSDTAETLRLTAEGIATKFEEIKAGAEEWIASVFGPDGSLPAGFADFVTSSGEKFTTFTEDVSTKFDELRTGLVAWVTDVFGPDGKLITGISELGPAIEAWWATVFGPEGSIAQAMSEFFGEGGVAQNFIDDFLAMGEDIIQALIDGVNNMWDEAVAIITDFFRSLVRIAKGVLGEESPSKVFAEIGRFLIEGFIKGLKEKRFEPSYAVSEILTNVVDSSNKAVNRGVGNLGRGSTTINKNVTVNMSASYQTNPSPVTVYHDITTALAGVNI